MAAKSPVIRDFRRIVVKVGSAANVLEPSIRLEATSIANTSFLVFVPETSFMVSPFYELELELEALPLNSFRTQFQQ